MLVQAGLAGIREGMALERAEPRSLPTSLDDALRLFEVSEAAEWLGEELHAAYIQFKRAEMSSLDNLDEAEVCRRYAQAY
jgi:glutamine synthetase